jgi:peroxiredoxin
MSDELEQVGEQPTPPVPKQKFSPALLVLLIFPLLGLIAALITAGSGNNTATGSSLPLTPGQGVLPRMDWAAPNMTLERIDGTFVQISDFRGRIVFLNFWATWCVPCVRELPAFTEFMRAQDPETGALVVGINAGETPETINAYFADHDISGITVLLDPTGAARSLYGVLGMPVTYVLDAEGIIRYMKIGEMTLEEMNGYVAQLSANG